jgi:chemosensory pili system protein ChpA (sensor histidine kinase/response regulator)
MQPNVPHSKAADLEMNANDLGPLAWVLDELRKSLEGAAKALKRFVREAETARGSDLAALDSSQLRIARQQLHQSVGALEMVDLPAPALVLRAMESAVQKFIQQPESCSIEAASKIERASFALTEYLQGVLSDRAVSSVSLFPQYREVQELVRADRIHPADLWLREWRWLEPEFAVGVAPQDYGPEARGLLDHFVLRLMKGKSLESAHELRNLSLGFVVRQTARQPRIFWKIAAAYFEALAHDLLQPDVYVKRASSRVLLQYASLAKGDLSVSDRLAQDLLFFCAQAEPSNGASTPVLAAVRSMYSLNRYRPIDYELVQFGRFDPALLAQARKRIISAKETWSSLAAGDLNKFKTVSDQFSLVTDSLVKLHAPSEPLAQALSRAVETTVRQGQAPRIELAMEVATSIMYLEAVFEDLDPNDAMLAVRTKNLADRLEGVRAGGEPQPLETWMEELYSRVSDKQTMGSVVGELRISLGELEKALDVFFRDTSDKAALQVVPAQLSQMRGVLSVLGLDQAAHAVMRMRASVEEMLTTEVDEQQARAAGTFDQLGNNVGALSFLIDMLNYQPALAKKLFVYDEEKGELKPLMGRVRKAGVPTYADSGSGQLLSQDVAFLAQEVQAGVVTDDMTDRLTALADQAALAGQSGLAQSARNASHALSSNDADAASLALSAFITEDPAVETNSTPQTQSGDFEEDDLRDIFLEEAREVTETSRVAMAALADDPSDLAQLTVLRRAFHTLKGSSRMVGLNEFGEAAWSFEQLLNSWLGDQKPADQTFRTLTSQAVDGFDQWVSDIAERRDVNRKATPFCVSADAMRLEGRYIDLASENKLRLAPAVGAPQAEFLSIQNFDLPDLNFDESRSQSLVNDQIDAPVEPDLVLETFDHVAVDLSASLLPSEKNTHADVKDSARIQEIDFDSVLNFTEANDSPLETAATSHSDVSSDSVESNSVPLHPTEIVDWSTTDFESHFSAEAVQSEKLAFSSAAAPEEMLSFESKIFESKILDSGKAPLMDLSSQQTPSPIHETPNASFASEALGETDEQTKVIGGLRIGIPLYNVYLNEADEWSRRLVTEVAEWALEQNQPISDSTVALAHSLAGSSATVGFHALSEISRAFEHALQQSQSHQRRDFAEHEALFVGAAEDIRRLLHQFAAGFLKTPDPALLEQLKTVEFVDSLPANENDFPSAPVIKLPEAEVDALSDDDELIFDLDEQIADKDSMATPARVFIDLPKLDAIAVPDAALTVATAFTNAEDDEIDAADAIDPDLFPIFEEEAAELMPQLGGALRQWSARPDNQSARSEVLRALHTLKGSARLAGAMRLGEMAHLIESEIEQIGSDRIQADEFDALLTRFDAMEVNFQALRQADVGSAIADDEVAVPVVQAVANLPVESGPVTTHHQDAPEKLVSDTAEKTSSDSGSLARKVAIPAPQAMVMKTVRQAANASVRVRSQLLDRMVNQAGEVMITRSRLEAELGQLRGSLSDMSGNLNRLRQQLRDIELQAETQMQSRLAQAKEAQAGFDPLEFDRFTRVQELTRMMAESVNDVATVQRTLQRTVEATEDDLIAQARQTRELQRDLLRTRMVEFEGISERLYRVVRQASKDTGKQVRLDLLGGTIEMDRGMLDRLTPAFEHLLRNCVAHGIENQADRVAAGKNAVGLITVHLKHENNDVSVDFSDDGAGLDLGRIRAKAVSQNLVGADRQLTDQEAADLIFMPGFSTATHVTELSGRGIGMDVVRTEVHSLGGRIETSTATGKGSHFRLVLPLTTAVTQVVMIRSGSLTIGVPANLIENVRRASSEELKRAYNLGTFDVAGTELPFFWSGALLQSSRNSVEPPSKTTPVVVFRSADQRIALHVDEVLGNQEVVVKNLGPQLSRLPGLAGMSVLASGAVILIYNPVALASIYGAQARTWVSLATDQVDGVSGKGSSGASFAGIAPQQAQIPLILVVDDSITVRRVTQRLLQREGYRVAMAADGLQALERLQEEVPSVVLSDIEMPRMDGFDLARNIRADARLRGLPIIMITSRIAEKHREHAMELGVDHYLGKPYSEDELMSLVKHYCSAETATAA